ncbi:MAG: hypothetical protein ACOX47_05640 [Bacillota bacterium]
MAKDSSRKLNIPLPIGKNLSVLYKEGEALNKAQFFGSLLGSGLLPVAVEFECGNCCKKVLNVADVDINGNFITFFPPEGGCLVLKVFSGGKLAETRILQSIIILVDQLISAEF